MNDFQSEYEKGSIPVNTGKPPIVLPSPEVVRELIPELNRKIKSDRSWIFRIVDFIGWCFTKLLGIVSMVFLLAFAANVPIVQFLSFGYLLEVTGRVARTKRLKHAFIGIQKATQIGSAILGAWLLLIPVRFASQLALEASLIDATSPQAKFMHGLVLVLMVLTVAHIAAAWFCGGKLKHFFWPIVAPFSFAIWFARKFAGSSVFRKLLNVTVGWLSPRLVDDICNAQPIGDWFLPAIVWKKIRKGRSYQLSRDALWDFVTDLNLGYYFKLGLKGFIGTALWLFVPTALLVVSTSLETAGALITGLLGTLIAIPVFSLLPFLQAHFATDGKLRRFVEVKTVLRKVGSAPLAHIIALLLMLVFALPLFLTKIEEIPTELLWSLSLVFILFTWPARVIVGWAYAQGSKRAKQRPWFVRYPILALAVPICFAFVFVLFFTRYITWNGALSLIENHVFLLPAPFWLDF